MRMCMVAITFICLAACGAPMHSRPIQDGMTPGVWFERAACGDTLSATTCADGGCSTVPLIIWEHDKDDMHDPRVVEIALPMAPPDLWIDAGATSANWSLLYDGHACYAMTVPSFGGTCLQAGAR